MRCSSLLLSEYVQGKASSRIYGRGSPLCLKLLLKAFSCSSKITDCGSSSFLPHMNAFSKLLGVPTTCQAQGRQWDSPWGPDRLFLPSDCPFAVCYDRLRPAPRIATCSQALLADPGNWKSFGKSLWMPHDRFFLCKVFTEHLLCVHLLIACGDESDMPGL